MILICSTIPIITGNEEPIHWYLSNSKFNRNRRTRCEASPRLLNSYSWNRANSISTDGPSLLHSQSEPSSRTTHLHPFRHQRKRSDRHCKKTLTWAEIVRWDANKCGAQASTSTTILKT
ncbi:unnamed protein product [Cuscuta europaea]|uniref:Uncharacterized protein n=1 Tax=Cuscuta europaea TaxID=41803 RepID=A0A9P0YQC8_CUSEU|nr:unnamed protein product [Cuscuta europaea]